MMTSSPVTTRPVPTGLSAGVVPPLRVWSARASKPKLLGEVWLPVTKVYTPAADLDAG